MTDNNLLIATKKKYFHLAEEEYYIWYPASKMFCSLIGREYIVWLKVPETLKDVIVLSWEKSEVPAWNSKDGIVIGGK